MSLAEKSVGARHKKQSGRQRPDAYAPLLASVRINQLHAQTPSPTTNAKIGKVFHENCQPQIHDCRAAFYIRYDLRSTFTEMIVIEPIPLFTVESHRKTFVARPFSVVHSAIRQPNDRRFESPRIMGK